MIDGIQIADQKIAERKRDAAERDRRRTYGLRRRHARILARRRDQT